VIETIILESVGTLALLSWASAEWRCLTRSRFGRRQAGPPS
jgi:hypothetical protein